MPVASWPRISLAKDLLQTIRGHLVAAAAHHSVPAGLSLDLLPIVEDGLVGYEFLPNRETNSYLTIGCDDCGEPVLRECLYRARPPSPVRVASVDGRALSQGEKGAGYGPRQRDAILPDWPSLAEAAWIELAAQFPQQPRHSIELNEALHQTLDEALEIAYAHLAQWDPCIDFCGVPDEALLYGFALTHPDGGRGLLEARQQGEWALQFQCADAAINEEWSIPEPAGDRTSAWARAGATRVYTTQHAALLFPINKAALAPRARRRANGGDRREGEDRRSSDRRHADRRLGDRRQADTFDAERFDERRHDERRRRDRRDRASH